MCSCMITLQPIFSSGNILQNYHITSNQGMDMDTVKIDLTGSPQALLIFPSYEIASPIELAHI